MRVVVPRGVPGIDASAVSPGNPDSRKSDPISAALPLKEIHIMSAVNGMVAGAIGGVAASLLMNVVRSYEKKEGIIANTPPEEVQDWVEEQTGTEYETGPRADKALSQVWHFGYGASLGALYGLMHSELDFEPLPAGPLYGLGVYALSLGAIGPALHITDPPWDESPPGTTPARILDHLIFGVVTAVVTEQVLSRTGSNGWRVD